MNYIHTHTKIERERDYFKKLIHVIVETNKFKKLWFILTGRSLCCSFQAEILFSKKLQVFFLRPSTD